MWTTFCEGLKAIGQGWAFCIMMVGIVYIVVRYQMFVKANEYAIIRDNMDNDAIIISEEEIEDDDE